MVRKGTHQLRDSRMRLRVIPTNLLGAAKNGIAVPLDSTVLEVEHFDHFQLHTVPEMDVAFDNSGQCTGAEQPQRRCPH